MFAIMISALLIESSCAEVFTREEVERIIYRESSGRVDAVSSQGAIGLMQVSPIVLQEYNDTHGTGHRTNDLYHPHTNITVGLWHLCRWEESKRDLIGMYWAGRRGYREYREGLRPHLHRLMLVYWEEVLEEEDRGIYLVRVEHE